MGLVLDSIVIVFAERQGVPVSELLGELRQRHGVTDFALSAISVAELVHGVWRAQSPQQADRRSRYLKTAFAAVPAEAFTSEIAHLVARVDAEARNQGVVIPFADLLIGGTALHLGYGIVTRNARHFRMIPGLEVRS